MPSRPALTDDSFLAHVFSPRKNPQPTGLRKTTLKGTRGQNRARVNAWNRMTSVKQAILQRAGKRDDYLRGNITFVEAKRELRHKAVESRIVKPLKRRPTVGNRENLKRFIASHIYKTTQHVTDRYGKRKANARAIVENLDLYLDDPTERMTEWTYDEISSAATGRTVDGRTYMVFDANGQQHNPFFYH